MDARSLLTWDSFKDSNPGSGLPQTEDSASRAAIAPRIVKWVSMFAGMRSADKTSSALRVSDAAFVQQYAQGVY